MPLSRRRFSQGLVAAPFVVTTPHAFAQTDRRPTLTVAVAQLPKVLEPALELNNVGTRVPIRSSTLLSVATSRDRPMAAAPRCCRIWRQHGSAKARNHCW